MAAALVVLLAQPSPASGQSGVLSRAYEALLRQYASGDRGRAIEDVVGWPEQRLRGEIAALEALRQEARVCPSCDAAIVWRRMPVRAALMLHSDSAQRARRDDRPTWPHESLAVEIARMLKDDDTHRVFARRWYEAMAGLAQDENRWGDALEWADRGVREFPDSAEMLLVSGSLEETVGAQAAPVLFAEALLQPDTSDRRANLAYLQELRGHLEKARRALRSAVAVDPALVEARLRLGRVAWRLGETAEARSALEEVLGLKPGADTAFLAHLFLGRLDEDAGRLEAAARSYEAALALDARCQSARLALSHVRLRLGDAAAARREVETALGFVDRRPGGDAYWRYPWGASLGVQEQLEALRREVSS